MPLLFPRSVPIWRADQELWVWSVNYIRFGEMNLLAPVQVLLSRQGWEQVTGQLRVSYPSPAPPLRGSIFFEMHLLVLVKVPFNAILNHPTEKVARQNCLSSFLWQAQILDDKKMSVWPAVAQKVAPHCKALYSPVVQCKFWRTGAHHKSPSHSHS